MAADVVKKGPKLRTKTGCLTCRLRRKKCDERTPLCERCTSSKRECIWPTRDALIDRRHGSRNGKTSPIQQDRSTAQVQHWNSETLKEPTKVDTAEPNISLESEAISQQLLRLELEPIISRHFVDTYYELLINPESHRDFYADWKDDLTALAKKSKGLHYAILANASSHLSLVDDSDSLHQVSLDFYSRSIRSLAHALGEGAPNPDTNAVLMSVMLLYLQGHVGEGTWHDIPYHVRAASRIIRLRFLQDPNFVITRPFERLAVESVLFQVFLVTTGHWSKQWKDHDYEFDVRFWLGCENLLNRCTLFPGRTTSCNSPVLGVPIPLFKLNLTIKRMCDHLGLVTAETLAHLRQEVLYWEAAIALGHERSTSHRSLCDDATFLYILIASLLVEQLENYAKDGSSIPPHPVATTKWQYESIFGILKRRHDDEGWHRTFVANWPVYTAGILVGTADDQAFIREAMKRRWARSSIYMVARYSKDLERFWSGNEDIGGSPSSATESGSELSEM